MQQKTTVCLVIIYTSLVVVLLWHWLAVSYQLPENAVSFRPTSTTQIYGVQQALSRDPRFIAQRLLESTVKELDQQTTQQLLHRKLLLEQYLALPHQLKTENEIKSLAPNATK